MLKVAARPIWGVDDNAIISTVQGSECRAKATQGLEENVQKGLDPRMLRAWGEEGSTYPCFSWTCATSLRRNKDAVLSSWQNPDPLVTEQRCQNGLLSPSAMKLVRRMSADPSRGEN